MLIVIRRFVIIMHLLFVVKDAGIDYVQETRTNQTSDMELVVLSPHAVTPSNNGRHDKHHFKYTSNTAY